MKALFRGVNRESLNVELDSEPNMKKVFIMTLDRTGSTNRTVLSLLLPCVSRVWNEDNISI